MPSGPGRELRTGVTHLLQGGPQLGIVVLQSASVNLQPRHRSLQVFKPLLPELLLLHLSTRLSLRLRDLKERPVSLTRAAPQTGGEQIEGKGLTWQVWASGTQFPGEGDKPLDRRSLLGHLFPPGPQLTSPSWAPGSPLGPRSARLVRPGLWSRSFSRACLLSSNSSWGESHHDNLISRPTPPSVLNNFLIRL